MHEVHGAAVAMELRYEREQPHWACTPPIMVTVEAEQEARAQIEAAVLHRVQDLLALVLADGQYYTVRLGPLCRQVRFKPLAAGSPLEFPLVVYWRELEWLPQRLY